MSGGSEMRARLVLEADGSAIVGMTQAVTGGLDKVTASTQKTSTALHVLATKSPAPTLEAVVASAAKAASGFTALGTETRKAGTALGTVQGAVTGATADLKKQAVELAATQRETAAYRAELDRVRAQFDPLFAAQLRYKSELRAIAQAERSGAISAEVATAARARALAGFEAVTASGKKMFASVGGGGMVMKNLAFQLNQIGQQGAVTGNYLGALSIQLPDILASFGFLGVLIGGVSAVLAPLAVELLTTGNAGKSLDKMMGELDQSLQSVADHLKTLRDQDLSLTFGNMSEDVRGLTSVLLELDRAAELKNLQDTLDKLLTEKIKPGFLQSAWASYLDTGPVQGAAEARQARLSKENFAKLTGGAGPSYEEFQARQRSIMASANAGDVRAVTDQIKSMLAAFADGKPVTEMNKDLLTMLTTLGSIAKKTAEVEAQFNGTAHASKIDKQMGEISRQYRDQADLAQAIAQYGEHSAQVAALRNQQARDALMLRLREMGVEEGSAREKKALADLEAEQAAQAKLTAAERQKSYDDTIAGMMRQIALSDTILTYGKDSAEVERERTNQAKEILAQKLREQGITEDQIVKAQALLETERARADEIKKADAARSAQQSLDQMRREAEIGAATVRFGRDSLQVKRLQIEAQRAEYAEKIKTLDIDQKTRDAMLAAWDAAKGLKSADPFGSASAARQILQTQAASIAKLQLQRSLIGQTELTQRRVMALYEAELEIRQKNIDTGSKAAAQIREQARAQAELNDQVERQGAAWEKVQQSMGGAIDKLLEGDFSGALDSLRKDLEQLAIANPLKNALLGTSEPTLADAGGLAGIWARLTGRGETFDPAKAAADAAMKSVASMQVNAGSVTISSMGTSGLLGANLGGAPGSLTGSDTVQSQIWQFFSGKGLAPHQIAGIMGNIQRESGFNPLAIGDGGTSFGLFQHHAGRAQGLLGALGGVGGLGDIKAQLEYAWKELLGSESGVLKKLFAATNVQDATAAFAGFERPQGWSMANPMGADGWTIRLGAAEQALSKFSATTLTSQANLGQLGQGFDTFGSFLANLGQGGGGAAGGSGFSIVGLIGTAMGLPGFDVGGPTGGSDPKRIAGFAHEKEFIFDARATARIGVANLEALRRGSMRGYESGGYASATAYPFLVDRHAPRSDQADTRPVINIVNNSSANVAGQIEETTDARGQRQWTLALSDAVATGISAPGGKARRTLSTEYGVRRKGVSRL